MTANLTQDVSLIGTDVVPSDTGEGHRAAAGHRTGGPRNGIPALWSTYRQVAIGYAQLLAGSGGRLVLQVVYFFVLANTLSLSEMGVFASVSAAGLLIGCLAGLGFQSFVMYAAAGRRSSLGAYLASFYVGVAIALPIMCVLAGALYLVLFKDMIALPGYLALMFVELVLWRGIELLVQVNNGLGRYAAASTLVSLPVAFRAVAALLFWAAGGGDTQTWSVYYLIANAISVAVLAYLFHPRVRLRLRPALLKGRLRASLLYVSSHVLFLSQGEIDKLIVLSLAGERMAGIYAISFRLIDLSGVPLRPIFMMYSRKLIQERRASLRMLRDSLKIEVLVIAFSTLTLLGLVTLLYLWPGILGPNVASAYGLLSVVIAIPAVRNLLEFHGEMLFSFGRLGQRTAITAAIVSIKGIAMALLLIVIPQPETWSLWLNAIYAGIYVLSFVVVYGIFMRSAVR